MTLALALALGGCGAPPPADPTDVAIEVARHRESPFLGAFEPREVAPPAGAEVPVVLTVTAERAVPAGRLRLDVPDALRLVAGPAEVALPAWTAGETRRLAWTVEVATEAPAVLVATIAPDGSDGSHAFGVSFHPAPAPGRDVVGPDGTRRRVIEVPVRRAR